MKNQGSAEQVPIQDKPNKVALITGSLSGIGLGIAHAFAALGFNVILNGFASEEEIKNTVTQFQTKYPKIIPFYIYADLTKAADCKKIVEQTIKKFGRIDILVNNAGTGHSAECVDLPQEKWEEMLALNLSAPFYLSKYTLPYMHKAGWGRIVNIGSISGLVGTPNCSAYVASKHGLLGFTKAVALQNAKKGITCNAVCPGYVLTPLLEKHIQSSAERDNISREQMIEKFLAKQPSAQFVTTAEVAEVVVFLASEHARQVNGAAWTIDGGWTAQ